MHAIVCPIVRARSRRCVDIRITNVLFVHRATRLFRRRVDRFRRATDSVSIVSSSWSERHAQKSRPIIRDRFARGVAGPPTFLCVHTRGGGARVTITMEKEATCAERFSSSFCSSAHDYPPAFPTDNRFHVQMRRPRHARPISEQPTDRRRENINYVSPFTGRAATFAANGYFFGKTLTETFTRYSTTVIYDGAKIDGRIDANDEKARRWDYPLVTPDYESANPIDRRLNSRTIRRSVQRTRLFLYEKFRFSFFYRNAVPLPTIHPSSSPFYKRSVRTLEN